MKKLFTVFMLGVLGMSGSLMAHGNHGKPTVEIKADGSKTIKDADGTFIEVKADGSKTVRKPDGTTVIINADGSKTIKDADGTTINVPSPAKAK